MENDKQIPFKLGHIVFAEKNKQLWGFHVTCDNVPGVLKKVTEKFSRNNVNIVSLAVPEASREEVVGIFIVGDFTNIQLDPREILEEILSVKEVRNAKLIKPLNNILHDPYFFPIIIGKSRVVLLGEANLKGFFNVFRERFGDEIALTVLYHLGYSVGLKAFELHFEEYAGDLTKCLNILSALLLSYGWARIETVSASKNGICIRAYDLWECSILDRRGSTGSSYFRGTLAGLFSRILGSEVSVIETKCISKGDPFCEFYIVVNE